MTAIVLQVNQPDQIIEIHDPLAKFFRFNLKLDWTKLWFFSVLYFGIFEKIILPYLGGFLNLSGGIKQWVPHVEALLTGFIEFPIFMAFYIWSGGGVLKLFDSLREHQNFKQPEKYDEFLEDALKSFRSKTLVVISLALAILVMLVMNFVIWSKTATVPPWFGDRPYMRLLSLFNITLVAFAVIQSIIREGMVIIWLRRLWQRLGDQLDVHQYHEDGAGGLGGIGHHAVNFLFFIAALLLFVLMATIIPSILAETTKDQGFSIRLWSPALILIWVSYLVLVPTMLILLIWPAHTLMVQKRNDRLACFTLKLDELLGLATQYAASTPKKAAETCEEMNGLKNIRTAILEDFPVWPITSESRTLIGLTSVLPTLYSIVTFVAGVLT